MPIGRVWQWALGGTARSKAEILNECTSHFTPERWKAFSDDVRWFRTNVSAQKYPEILVRVGLNDPRVGYWEGAKLAARLRELKTDDHRVLVKVNMGAGHGGASGRYSRLREAAFNYAYILSQHGLASLETKPPADWKK